LTALKKNGLKISATSSKYEVALASRLLNGKKDPRTNHKSLTRDRSMTCELTSTEAVSMHDKQPFALRSLFAPQTFRARGQSSRNTDIFSMTAEFYTRNIVSQPKLIVSLVISLLNANITQLAFGENDENDENEEA
jgi:hypothetical protein